MNTNEIPITDKEIVLEAVKNDGRALEYASEELKANKKKYLGKIR